LDLRQRLESALGDGYRFERELGRGGMSRVFLAHERTLARDVVVKVLPPEMAAEVSVERFQREIQVAAKLNHPHIVPVLAAGDAQGLPFLVMPYIAGETLRARLTREGELPIPEAIRLLRDTAAALDHAHRSGIAHRDIKPENILLTGGAAIVADFGVAKALAAAVAEHEGVDTPRTLTSVGVALGTPAYMAPEQAAADPNTDHRADIYSWGVVAYEMLAGIPPFSGRSPQALFAAHMAEPVRRIELLRQGCPPALADLIMRALEKRPADRPQTAAELVQTLDNLSSGYTSGPTAASSGAPRARKPRWALRAGIAAAVVLITASVIYFRGPPASNSDSIRSIAVLPFVNAGGSGEADDYFVEGMSDELTAALGKIPGLQVASRTSTYAFKGESVDVRQVGTRLKVDAVLEGRVRRAGDRLRVTAQLTNVSTGLSFWTDTYERQVSDIFAVQDDIARSIAHALQVRLEEAAAAALGRTQGTADLEAYDFYLRGRYYWHRRGASNLENATTFFQRAIARDPGFARAHAGLAIAQVLIPEYTDVGDPSEYNLRAEAAARRALELDSTLAEAYAARGLARVHQWDWQGAEAAYRHAIALDPRYATAYQWYGELQYHLGRTAEAVDQIRRAAELDPLAPISAVALSYAYIGARQFENALSEGERAVNLAPDLGLAYRGVAVAALLAGQREKALQASARALELEPNFDLGIGQAAYVLGRLGQTEEAGRLLRQLQASGTPRAYVMMWARLALGEYDRAAAELERAVQAHDPQLTNFSIVADPAFDPIRNTPAYRRAIQAMRLPLPPAR
jgi:eukaryotic-like serine/threonine-protein kinase